ncbi:unnamed protein product [Rotaria sp. Silwood1]|nr:unnamed protein product [Rotaria sp. Silwood1]
MCQNPGSIYFVAFNIGNILLLWLSLFPFTYCSISVGSIIYVYTQVTTNANVSFEQQDLNSFLIEFSLNLIFLQSYLSLYSNIIISSPFRKRFQKYLQQLCLPSYHRSTDESTMGRRTVADNMAFRLYPMITNH